MTRQIKDLARFSEDDTQFLQEYGLKTVNIGFENMDGEIEDIKSKIIVKVHVDGDEEPIGVVGKDYSLLPNQKLKEIADAVTPELNLRARDTITHNHTIVLLYDYGQDISIGEVDGIEDLITYTIAIKGSEDGSSGTTIAGGSYRYSCSNKALVFIHKDCTSKKHKRHSKNFVMDEATLKSDLEEVIANLDNISIAYRRWFNKPFRKEHLDKFEKLKIPKKYYPEWMIPEEEEEIDEKGRKAESKSVAVPKGTTWWEVYNELTNAITHEEGISQNTQDVLNRELHKLFEVV
jgi:hypothetical protein